ncbi:unnamed protein product [Owenia fusiformis]|uniref:Inositol-1-monophosphatase n=1 Tax=Owenia fusiformis TaxID=6347 RepID=A0A8J1Y976_OWEFU|nr:unnamed protein product [Owenia fusiformis]
MDKIEVKSSDIDEYLRVAIDVAKEAGKVICSALEVEKRIETKESLADLVTETDQQVEKMIISTFHQKFPTHCFIGEESVSSGEKCTLTNAPTWIIDPIDGTTNFVHRFQFSCISIGLLINKRTEVAVVFNPNLDHMYTAKRGHGAYCNNTKLKVSDVNNLQNALILAEFGSSRDPEKMTKRVETMHRIVNKSHGIRSLGSAAMAMCLVASGRGEAYYEYGIHCWDVAAGDLIVREAGGVVLDPSGSDMDMMARRVICACNKDIADQVISLLQTVEFERDSEEVVSGK